MAEEIIYTRRAPSGSRPLYRVSQIVWYILWAVEIILLFRFILKLVGANPAATFTDFIYTLSSPLIAPFVAVFPTTRVEGSVFEWVTLLAMLVYWILALAITKLLAMGRPVSETEARERLYEQEQ